MLALAAIKRGFGVIYIDPKGDDFVRDQLRAAAARAGRPFRLWDPQGKTTYNPYDRGSNTEIADKLLAAEVFTEPHYQRLAQRYIGHVVRTLRLAGVPVSLATVVEHMHNGRLASLPRKMTPTDARPLLAYLETLTPQQERDLAGARDRLAILAESDVGHLLEPATGGEQLDLRESLDRGDVVLFRLEADRRPLAAEMLGAAIVQDLVAISQERQHGEQRPALVIIDEFSAFGAPQTQRLFGRGRGAWRRQGVVRAEHVLAGLAGSRARGRNGPHVHRQRGYVRAASPVLRAPAAPVGGRACAAGRPVAARRPAALLSRVRAAPPRCARSRAARRGRRARRNPAAQPHTTWAWECAGQRSLHGARSALRAGRSRERVPSSAR